LHTRCGRDTMRTAPALLISLSLLGIRRYRTYDTIMVL
jgi:hypothetical protein